MCWMQFVGMGTQAGQGMLQGAQSAETLNANAATMDLKAEDAMKRGSIAEDVHRSKARQFMGSQRAAMGASGVDMNTGTMAELQTDTAAMGELDAQTIRSNAMREAWGYTNEANSLRAQAVQAGMMQRLLMPGAEGGSVKDVLGQQIMGGNPFAIGKQREYIQTGKYNASKSGWGGHSYVYGKV